MSRAPKLTLTLQFPAAKAWPAHQAALPRASVARWIKAALFVDAQLTVRLVDAEEGLSLNRTWRGQNHATNVLTFAYAEGDEADDAPISGDLILCCPVVEREAAEQGKPLDAHYAHLLVHGALHAQGYDHENDADAEEMEALESEILTGLGFPDPYA
ncbi:rRNA maturation RNase YbeY [Paraburkholderia bonniea]|uniref:rRNA maturation RNase YbeY n=1 Tax=Paraburkholderia bonniea TaxID=2152891 RepID=UPI001290D70E|nr:rRNA maturation RNase YbeY [Paraburkholderia bonniea]WJF90729.1 rRNA maturation RNase YbeY [Paraburkholderia bonniea]WJF94042.1 rRNA maturation RNase YbeY [Paraburkholderia bonniea]